MSAGWHSGCRCTLCRRAHSDAQRTWWRGRAQRRLPVDVRQELLDAIYDRKPFRQALRDLGLTPNQVWGLTKMWNNTGDKVILRRADGSLKDTCSYPGEGASKYYC
jgi:hypothetical protein